MQKMLNLYDRLYGATGGVIENQKSKLYAWQWKWKQGQKELVQNKIEIWLNGRKLMEINPKESQRTLGVFMNPQLKWEKQFEAMKEKMCRAMSRLKGTSISIANAYVFFNMYLIKQVYFGCGIIELLPAQEKILLHICESTLLKKLRLSEKFPRRILYARKSELGVGILKPTTMIAILALKLYLGHKRNKDRISKIIEINEKNVAYQYGYSQKLLDINRTMKPKNVIWSDEIANILQSRGIVLVNVDESRNYKTQNKTVMDLAHEYIKTYKHNNNLHAILNQVRLYKKINLPCELVGLLGSGEIEDYRVAEKSSCFEWTIKHLNVPKPSKKSFDS